MAILQISGTLSDFLDMTCDYHLGVVTATPQQSNPGSCTTLGDLSRVDSNGNDCGLAAGSYITKDDVLADSVLCTLQTGTGDWDGTEAPMDAMFASTDAQRNGPGGCNEGFFRADAPLFVIVVSDVDDNNSGGTPQQWFDDLVAFKGGHEENVSIAEIIDIDGSCAEHALKLDQFQQQALPGHKGVTDLCEPAQIDDDLKAAIELLGNSACEDFLPP
jgi:hypothetical protein